MGVEERLQMRFEAIRQVEDKGERGRGGGGGGEEGVGGEERRWGGRRGGGGERDALAEMMHECGALGAATMQVRLETERRTAYVKLKMSLQSPAAVSQQRSQSLLLAWVGAWVESRRKTAQYSIITSPINHVTDIQFHGLVVGSPSCHP